MADANDWKIMGPIIAALVGIYGFVLKHLANTDRHPAKKDIVFREVCKPQMDRLEDCMGKDIKALEKLMNQRFDNLERLIKDERD